MKINYNRIQNGEKIRQKRRRIRKERVLNVGFVTGNCPEHDTYYLPRAVVRNTSDGKYRATLSLLYPGQQTGFSAVLKQYLIRT